MFGKNKGDEDVCKLIAFINHLLHKDTRNLIVSFSLVFSLSACSKSGGGALSSVALPTNSGIATTITSSASASTNVSPIPVTVTFASSVTGFVAGDVTIGNGTISNFLGSGTTYTFDVTPSGQGAVTVDVAQGVTLLPNASATQLSRIYDTVAPSVTGLANDATWTKSKTWSWGCNETCTYRYTIDTTSNTAPSGAYAGTATATQNTGTNTYYLHIQAQDAAGNVSGVTHYSALIDNTAPVAPSALGDGSLLNSLTQSPTIVFTSGTDADSGILSHQVRVLRVSDNQEMKTWANFTTGNPVTGLSLASNTDYKVEIKAIDNAGNETSAASNGWTADTTAPSAPSALALNNPASTPGTDNTPTITVSGVVSGDVIHMYKDSSCKQEVASGTAAGTTIDLTTSTLTSSNYTFYATAVDPATNVSACSSASVSYTLSGWGPEAYLKAPNAEAGDLFGAVAIDGNTAIVGANSEDSNQTTITNGSTASSDNSLTNSGAAYIFKRTGSSWVQEAYLKAPNAKTANYFGSSVAISGDTAIVGAYAEDSNQTTITNGATASSDNSAANSGAVYVFKRTGSNWAQEAYLKAPNADVDDYFSASVAISSDTIVVGAYPEDSSQTTITNGSTASSNNVLTTSGAAYIFKRTGSNWAQEAYLKASNANLYDFFGFTVAISGDTVVIGAVDEDSNQTTITNGATASTDNSASDAGAVYVFKRTGSNWAQEAYLKAPNAEANDTFGSTVAIDGDTVIVGADGESSNQTTITNGTTASGNNSAAASGAAYVFKRTGTNWAHEAYLKAPNAEASDRFGRRVSISADTVVVGALFENSNQTTVTNGTTASNDNSAVWSGAAYIFKRTGSNWAQEAYVKTPNAEASDWIGGSVGISSDTVILGASGEDSNQTTITNGPTASNDNSAASSGAAYVFRLH